ncbi:hypothetical protein [Portibacter marinus]|uniref:hypothetical protein n=1 Tax=Portibacter marinus TaxID=2898660 RepID=UPI001F24B9A3|nr:hypothetical protein [Portibacter marinus]
MINVKAEILDHFYAAEDLLQNIDEALANIDVLIKILENVKCQTFNSNYFYNCLDVSGLCDYEDETLVPVHQNQFPSIRNIEYDRYFKIPVIDVLTNLGLAMQNIQTYYILLFDINMDYFEEYNDFEARLEGVKIYVRPVIDKSISPHQNAINYAIGIKEILKQNLPEVLEKYKHHISTLEEKLG